MIELLPCIQYTCNRMVRNIDLREEAQSAAFERILLTSQKMTVSPALATTITKSAAIDILKGEATRNKWTVSKVPPDVGYSSSIEMLLDLQEWLLQQSKVRQKVITWVMGHKGDREPAATLAVKLHVSRQSVQSSLGALKLYLTERMVS